jgi:hypothetical protein
MRTKLATLNSLSVYIIIWSGLVPATPTACPIQVRCPLSPRTLPVPSASSLTLAKFTSCLPAAFAQANSHLRAWFRAGCVINGPSRMSEISLISLPILALKSPHSSIRGKTWMTRAIFKERGKGVGHSCKGKSWRLLRVDRVDVYRPQHDILMKPKQFLLHCTQMHCRLCESKCRCRKSAH